jgi:hypothetical protein
MGHLVEEDPDAREHCGDRIGEPGRRSGAVGHGEGVDHARRRLLRSEEAPIIN